MRGIENQQDSSWSGASNIGPKALILIGSWVKCQSVWG